MVCGFVMAKKGEKISKSKGNASLSPEALIETYSADALRYWAANSRLGTDTLFSEDELKISGRFLTKLWNASRFCLMHLEDFDGHKPEKLLPIDQWIMERSRETVSKAAAALSDYEVGSARQDIDSFFWNDFCDHYLEIVKDRLYKPEIHGTEERRSAQFALYQTLLTLLKLYAPFVPHITEAIYQAYFRAFEGTVSLHLTQWEEAPKYAHTLINFGDRIMSIMSEVRRYKSERSLSLKTELPELLIQAEDWCLSLLRKTQKDIKAATGALTLTLKPGAFSVHIPE